MATGGQSLPKSGSDGHGWSIAQTTWPYGHSHLSLPLFLSFWRTVFFTADFPASLTRPRSQHDVEGKIVDERTGSLLWTHFGVSGPVVVLDASRFWVIAHGSRATTRPSPSISYPERRSKRLNAWITDAARHPGRKTVHTLLSQQLPHRVVRSPLQLCWNDHVTRHPLKTHKKDRSIDIGAMALNKLPRAPTSSLDGKLSQISSLPVVGNRGWNHAEVTAGGIPLQEVNPQSMASRKVSGLYLIGEMLDCDGRIGGFNFQWAWSTGYIAGYSVANELKTIPE